MKSHIVLNVLIVELIVLFGLVGCTESNRHDNDQTGQNESRRIDRNPIHGSTMESQSESDKKNVAKIGTESNTKHLNEQTTVEAKIADETPAKNDGTPLEDKPGIEEKQMVEKDSTAGKDTVDTKAETKDKSEVETKSLAAEKGENILVETPATNKESSANGAEQVETKSISAAEVTFGDKFAPAAVPVASVEEAEKLNSLAIFLSEAKTTVVEGEIIERSELPDPQKSDYPNCRFTARFNGSSIKSGKPCPKEMALIIEGFIHYNILDSNNFSPGDKVECSVIPFDSLPEEHKSTQQADDLNLFLLENYYAIDIRKINSFTDDATMPRSGIFFSDGTEEYISIFERHLNSPVSQEIKKEQNDSIRNDLEKMNSLLKDYNDEKINEINSAFAVVWNEEKKKDPPGYNRVLNNNYVWRNIDNSFWCLPANYTLLSKPDLLTQKTLDGFAALKKACEANGVQLIVSLIPNLMSISARVINKSFRDIPDLQTATYVKQLSEIGVETIYSSDAIIQDYNRFPFAFFFPGNSHPSDTVQDITSDILAERLKRYNVMPVLDPDLFSIKQSPHYLYTDDKYLFPEKCDIGDNEAKKPYTCREVLYDGKQIPRTDDAPIIALGNSFLQTPMFSPDSLPTLLSMKLLSTVDFSRVESFGPFTSMISSIIAKPERYLTKKKVLIMQFGTNALTEANIKSFMINIQEEDSNRVLFNHKSIILTYDDLKSDPVNESINSDLWSNLAQKHVYTLNEDSPKDIVSFTIEQDIDTSAEIVCVIPALSFRGDTASLVVNGIKKDIPTFCNNPTYSFISFVLPSDTKTINVCAEGNKGSTFAIKNIQLWQ